MSASSTLTRRLTVEDGRCPLPAVIAPALALEATEPFARSLTPGIVVTAQGPYASYAGALDVVSREWYLHAPDVLEPEPASFGYALTQLEQLVYEVHDLVAPDGLAPVLLGDAETATLALTLALFIPDLLSGVIARDGRLPAVGGLELPEGNLGGLPVVLSRRRSEAAALDDLSVELKRRGAEIRVLDGAADADQRARLAEWLAGLGGPSGENRETDGDRDV